MLIPTFLALAIPCIQPAVEGFYRQPFAADREAEQRFCPIIQWTGVWPRTQCLGNCTHYYKPEHENPAPFPHVTIWMPRKNPECEGGGLSWIAIASYLPHDVGWGEIIYKIDCWKIDEEQGVQ